MILEALTFAFGHDVHFEGVLHGIVWLIIVVVTMVIAEELVVRFIASSLEPASRSGRSPALRIFNVDAVAR